ncbi:MAG: TraR/DksA family transcriptional regulator [Myxococcales bacterium]|nr:TraR/DksA family transcriptional regulator [Myxococcales bacterium]
MDFSEKELAHFEKLLGKRETEVLERLTVNEELTRPVSPDSSLGRLTRQDALQDQQMALNTVRRLETQLQQIRAARSRIQMGTYGECPRCGDEIERTRLEVVPEAPFCLGCQG